MGPAPTSEILKSRPLNLPEHAIQSLVNSFSLLRSEADMKHLVEIVRDSSDPSPVKPGGVNPLLLTEDAAQKVKQGIAGLLQQRGVSLLD
jgi:hypothetical protein